jgi:methylthioribose-1-phosphate isomerase
MVIKTISWTNGSVKIIDQTKLPGQLVYIICRDVPTLWKAIKRLSVRGAPALGAAAAFGVLLGFKSFSGKSRKAFDQHIQKVCHYLGTSRPTAVNLFHSLKLMRDILKAYPDDSIFQVQARLRDKAFEIFETDRRVCRKMGEYGSTLIKNKAQVMTVCNAGALATVDYGTALGVFYKAKEKGKTFKVFSCETRPLLQGARLTTWELLQNKIDTTLICDNMAATLMNQRKIDAVFTGADRIAANGDTANKIGTYMLAVLAKHHNVPFYVVAPLSTFDIHIQDGRQIPIEQRSAREVISFGSRTTAPANVKVFNPAFDVTDHSLISGIVTEYGVIRPPFKTNIQKMFDRHARQTK